VVYGLGCEELGYPAVLARLALNACQAGSNLRLIDSSKLKVEGTLHARVSEGEGLVRRLVAKNRTLPNFLKGEGGASLPFT